MSDPRTDLEINCTAQLSLLEACRADNPELRIVFAGTRQIYGRPRHLPVGEAHPIDPGRRQRDQQDRGRVVPPPLRAGLRPAGHRAAPDEHLRPADARPRRAPDLPRPVDPAGARRRGAARLRRRALSGGTSPTSTTSCARSAWRRPSPAAHRRGVQRRRARTPDVSLEETAELARAARRLRAATASCPSPRTA